MKYLIVYLDKGCLVDCIIPDQQKALDIIEWCLEKQHPYEAFKVEDGSIRKLKSVIKRELIQ